jgi:peptidoglycan hydrolase-like protein with peptidoglycan-binding domain/3D (Asp-Asp-Asp) domain-containing protein
MHKLPSTFLVSAMIAGLLPVHAIAQESSESSVVTPTEPYVQDFVLTAYYSPLPDQCCYVKGSYDADKILNGNGTHAADGTPVYEGMIAAPASYPFGTRIQLPGLGTFTVHDRGGAIQEWDDTHRLDIWMGSGEEGLARALAFGIQSFRGTVYPVGVQDMPENAFDITSLPASLTSIQRYAVTEDETDSTTETAEEAVDVSTESTEPIAVETASMGARGEAVRVVQEQLLALGYFAHEVTSYFGDVTRASLASFMTDMSLPDSPDMVTNTVQNYLQAAVFFKNAPSPVAFVDETSPPSDIKKTQRYLRHLGYYRGRTDGQYSTKLFNAIFAFQYKNSLVGSPVSPGAGRIGPLTKGLLDRGMMLRRIASYMKRVQKMSVADSGELGTL